VDQKWEFYTTTEPHDIRLVWGWRVRQDTRLLRQSDLYDSFLSCYRNALANGFSGEDTHIITDVSADTVKACRSLSEAGDQLRQPTSGGQ
jgi:hypothetical protein